MPDGTLTGAQDIEDFTRGTDFMSASGGGPTTEARGFLGELIAEGKAVGWCDLAALPDDALVASCFFTGSVAPTRYARGDAEAAHDVSVTVPHPTVAAVEELEARMGVTFDAVVPIEIGGNNTGTALATAVHLGKLVLDADYAGRAIPETMCTAPHLAGFTMAPFACADYYGNRAFVADAANNVMAERLGKHLAMAAFGSIGCAAFALSGRDAKAIAVPGTLTRSLDIGRAIREAREAGADPVAALGEAVDGLWPLFRGTIAKRQWESREGYMWGEHLIEGSGDFTGHEMRLWFKNENHVSWLDGAPYVAGPDVLEVIDPATGEPLVNSFMEEGQEVAVIGVKRCARFDTPEGIAALGPRHWGFDFDFTPIEALVA